MYSVIIDVRVMSSASCAGVVPSGIIRLCFAIIPGGPGPIVAVVGTASRIPIYQKRPYGHVQPVAAAHNAVVIVIKTKRGGRNIPIIRKAA